mgnify:FL=1
MMRNEILYNLYSIGHWLLVNMSNILNKNLNRLSLVCKYGEEQPNVQ